jgi:hypothetical protein
MTHLVHKNENNNDFQHKIDGESVPKQCYTCKTRKTIVDEYFFKILCAQEGALS